MVCICTAPTVARPTARCQACIASRARSSSKSDCYAPRNIDSSALGGTPSSSLTRNWQLRQARTLQCKTRTSTSTLPALVHKLCLAEPASDTTRTFWCLADDRSTGTMLLLLRSDCAFADPCEHGPARSRHCHVSSNGVRAQAMYTGVCGPAGVSGCIFARTGPCEIGIAALHERYTVHFIYAQNVSNGRLERVIPNPGDHVLAPFASCEHRHAVSAIAQATSHTITHGAPNPFIR